MAIAFNVASSSSSSSPLQAPSSVSLCASFLLCSPCASNSHRLRSCESAIACRCQFTTCRSFIAVKCTTTDSLEGRPSLLTPPEAQRRIVVNDSKHTCCGSAIPNLSLSNDYLSKIVDPNDEWISIRTGTRNRRVLSGVSSNKDQQLIIRCRQPATEREEAKEVLLQFLRNLGLSTTLSSRLTKKAARFLDHLLAILRSRYYHSYVIDIEPTTAEIQGTLLSYLSALAAEHGEGFIDFLVYFPDPAPITLFSSGIKPTLPSRGKSSQIRDKTGTSRLTLEGNFRPSVSYALSLGLTLNQVEDLAKKSPSFVTCNPERNIQPVVSYFLGLGVPKPGIVKILLKRPQVFVCNLEDYLKPSMLYLESLGVKKSQWPRILVQFPALLTYGTPKINAAVEFLHAAGLSSADVGGIISRFPHIVSFSVPEKLEPTLKFLKNIGVKEVAAFLRTSPQVMGYSVEGNMKPTVRFLIELGYSQTQVTTMVNKFPQLLGLAISSNIKPKWDYYAETGWPKSLLVAFPQYFGYSLEGRIKPRFREVLKHGLSWTPNRILSTSNSQFHRLLAIHAQTAMTSQASIVDQS